MFELQEILTEAKYSLATKDARYLETVRNRIDTMVMALDKVLDCSDGFPISDFATANCATS